MLYTKETEKYATYYFNYSVAAGVYHFRGSKKIIKGGVKMTREKMIQTVDLICENNGYEDSPAYDLIYSQCVAGRPDGDAVKMIEDLLASFNNK